MQYSQGVIRIAHVADLHFGRRMTTVSQQGDNVRELDIYAAGDLVANYIALTLQPDVLVVAGDIWDTAVPGPLAVRHGFDFHQTIRSADIPVIVIGGNHDTLTSLNKATPLEHLARYFDCQVVTEQQSLTVCGLNMVCVPYRTLSTGSLTAPSWSQEVPNILIAHATADGAELPDFAEYDRTRLPRSLTQADEISLGMLGHIHIHGEVAPHVYYSGALERLKWGEIENEPSIYLHEIHDDGSVHTQSISVRSMGNGMIPRPALHHTIDCSSYDAAQVVDAAIEAIDTHAPAEGLLQLTLARAPREINTLAYEDTLHKRAKTREVFAMKIRAQLRAGEEWKFESQGPAPGATLADAYLDWAQHHGYEHIAELGADMIGGRTT